MPEGSLAGSNALASARWADPAYICDKYYFEPGDIWLGRNPHNFDQAVGVKPDEHIFLCASTGSGKGRSIIINNVALWPGSLVVYDPKGDLPAICAPARGDGDEWSAPMGQKVIVLDPLGHSKSDKKYLGYYDPVASLDPDDPGFREMCASLAQALVKIPEDSNHGEWAKMGREFVATIIEHVVSSGDYESDPSERNLFTVLNLIKKGHRDAFVEHCDLAVESGELDPKDYNERLESLGDPYHFLFEGMAKGAHNPHLRDEADKLLQTYKKTPKTFTSIRDEAARGLDWITKHAGMETALVGKLNGKRILSSHQAFDPKELKQNPDGVSLFIVLPSDRMETFGAWVQALFVGIFAAMRRTPSHPDMRHPTLGIIDEFSSLGKQDYIANALDTIRDEGMRLMIAVQQFGWMQDLYGKRTESFLENCSVKLFFGNPGETASDYLVKALGETEIIKYAVTKSRSQADMEGRHTSTAESASEATAEGLQSTQTFGSTETESSSRAQALGTSHTDSRNQSTSTSKSWNWNNSTNWSNGRNWGQGNGQQMGRNYGPHVFWEGLEHSTNYGTTLSRNSGGSHSKGGGKSHGASRSKTTQRGTGSSDTSSKTDTTTTGLSVAKSRSEAETRSRTRTQTTGETHTYGANESQTHTEGESSAQSFHKKPLLEYQEIRKYLSKVPENEHDHPAYPGLMLAIIGREDPVLLRRSNYDQDPFFEGLFSKHPKFPLLSYDEQPMLGYEFTPDHILTVTLPSVLREFNYHIEPLVRPYSILKKGDPAFHLITRDGKKILAKATHPGRVMSVRPARTKEGNALRVKIWSREGAEAAARDLGRFIEPWTVATQELIDESAAQAKRALEKAKKQEELARQRMERERLAAKRAKEEELAEAARETAVRRFSKYYDERDFNVLAKPLMHRLCWFAFGVGCLGGFFTAGITVIVGIGVCIALSSNHHEEERKLEDEKRRLRDQFGSPELHERFKDRVYSANQRLKPSYADVFDRYLLQRIFGKK
ncbi:MAG: type IV secretory system conjugative DNA transfer family protein [Pseudomonadota bacterium]